VDKLAEHLAMDNRVNTLVNQNNASQVLIRLHLPEAQALVELACSLDPT
jgi:hypothetical protein